MPFSFTLGPTPETVPPPGYEYRSIDRSVLKPLYDRFFVKPLVHRLTDRTAPNDVSLASQLCALVPVVAALLLGIFSARWVWYLVVPLGYLGYIVLDYADGAHARRTGTSSPLGELVDHWCDAWNSVLLPAVWGHALGAPAWVCCLLGALTGLAYVQAMVDHRETGTMRMDFLGAGEAMTFMMLSMIPLGVVGREAMGRIELPLDIRLVDFLFVGCGVGSGVTAIVMVARRGFSAALGSAWFIVAAGVGVLWVGLGLHLVVGMFLISGLCAIHAGRNVLGRTAGLDVRADATTLLLLVACFLASRTPQLHGSQNILGAAAAVAAITRAVGDFVWGLRALRFWLRRRELLGVLAPRLASR